MSFFLLSLGSSPVWADSSEWESGGGMGKRLAEIAEKASTDPRALAELYRMQEGYVDRAAREWRDGGEGKKLQEASSLLQRNIERINSSLTIATEAADAMSTRIRQSELLEKTAHLETTAKGAGARLAARWERERAAREREREQRERDAGERVRGQRL
jgi:hypothetical protein